MALAAGEGERVIEGFGFRTVALRQASRYKPFASPGRSVHLAVQVDRLPFYTVEITHQHRRVTDRRCCEGDTAQAADLGSPSEKVFALRDHLGVGTLPYRRYSATQR
jgi:hypothetical protein